MSIERTTKHMSIAKGLILRLIATEPDWRRMLSDFKGTREEALEAIGEMPGKFISPCDCKKNDDGSCAGIPDAKKETP